MEGERHLAGKFNHYMNERILTYFRQHKKMFSITGIGIISSYLLLSLIFSDLGLFKYFSMRGEYNRIKRDISRLKVENKRLRGEVDALKTDPDYIEALARERLGLAKDGEIIYKFPGPDEKGGGQYFRDK